MENTSLIGLSRQVALRRELDIIANNLANLTTAGFKGEKVLFEEYLMPVARTQSFGQRDSRLSFVQDLATMHDFAAGPIQQTGNPLDVAIDGTGFFAVETPAGERFQRSGAFQVNSLGELVTSEGFRVLGEAGPIVFEPNDTGIAIARDGTVSASGGTRGRLRLARFENPQTLVKDGTSTWRATAEALPVDVSTGVVQGAIERSNVRAVTELGRMIEVTRAYSSLASLMQSGDELRRDAIRSLADVPN